MSTAAMKRALSIFALIILASPAAHAEEVEVCPDAQSQAELNECADKSYKASDAELNTLYRQIRRRLNDDPDTSKLLVAAQRAWVTFRDAECGFSSSMTSGGSAYPMVWAMCLDGLTKSRIEDFKGYLNCEEGDMSCPVPAGTGGSLGFTLNTSFSPNAMKRLSALGEAVIVSAAYYGDPKPTAEQHADAVGRIQLGSENLEVPAKPGAVRITGANVKTDRLDWVAGDVKVNVNLFSARKDSQDNLLACDFIDGKLADVAQAPVTLHCALIEENPDTKLKP